MYIHHHQASCFFLNISLAQNNVSFNFMNDVFYDDTDEEVLTISYLIESIFL